MNPNEPVSPGASALGATSSLIDSNAAARRVVIVIHSRELLLACMSQWLRTLSQDFEVIGALDVRRLLSSDALPRACAIVFGAISPIWPDTWLQDQIALLRTTQPALPIVVICEEDIAEKYDGMKLQGFIPTSSNMETAAAVIKLVTMGGSYIAYAWDKTTHSRLALPRHAATDQGASSDALLTPREEAVFNLLQRGMPNKLVAYNLRISQSTVKAHVHNIIAKLGVRNRTEAALLGNNHNNNPPTNRTQTAFAGHEREVLEPDMEGAAQPLPNRKVPARELAPNGYQARRTNRRRHATNKNRTVS